MEQRELRPPQWPLKFLRLFLKKDYLEEIEGDMEEIFYENVERFSPRKANRMYVAEMMKLLRPNLVKRLGFINNIVPFGMLKNYFKVTVRGLLKRPVNSFINLFGLAAGIGICVFAYSFTRWTLNRDQFHENKELVFLSTFYASREGSLQQYGKAPRPLAELLKQDFPQVNKVCRVEDRTVVVKHYDQVFNERMRFVDAEFLEMFTFPLKWGTAASLKDVNSIIISEPMSEKYFGDANPVGSTILVKFDKDRRKEFKVTGVAQKFPAARSLDFTFLINFENLRTSEDNYNTHDWAAFMGAALIQVSNPSDIQSIQQGMEKYRQLQNKVVTEDFAISSFAFEQLATIHLRTDDIRDDIFRGGSASNIATIGFLVVVCLLMLALACFSYVNIAIVTAAKRLKELGVRKSIGATRKTLVVQFLSENVVLTSFALVLGILFGRFVVIPWFEKLWTFSMDFRFDDINLWIYLAIVSLITAIASGIYPSLYISRFQTVDILRGSLRFGQRNPITKILLGFQLVFACIFITSAVLFTQNADYTAHRSWGYSNRDVIYAQLPDELSLDQLKAAIEQNPDVVSTAKSAQHVGKRLEKLLIHFPASEFEVEMVAVDANYFKTLGIEIAAGRGFNDHENSDSRAVVVNETMAKNLEWSDPIGQQFKIDSTQYEVIGVAKDFHSYSFDTPLKPTFFKVAPKGEHRFLSIKVNDGTQQSSFEQLMKTWAKLFPEVPFNGGYQEDVWGSYYLEIGIHGHVWRVFASVAIILATLGVYGLVSLNVSGRVKEFSIRKILGAKVMNVAVNILRQYAILFFVAITTGVIASYYFIKFVLDFAYTYHIPVTIWNVMFSAVLLVLVLAIIVGTQVAKVVKSNPVEGLNAE